MGIILRRRYDYETTTKASCVKMLKRKESLAIQSSNCASLDEVSMTQRAHNYANQFSNCGVISNCFRSMIFLFDCGIRRSDELFGILLDYHSNCCLNRLYISCEMKGSEKMKRWARFMLLFYMVLHFSTFIVNSWAKYILFLLIALENHNSILT